MNLYVYISLGISYFLSRRSHTRNAKTPHIHLLIPTFFSHGEIMAAWVDLKRPGIDFTRLELACLLTLRQKYHEDASPYQRRLNFARYLVERGYLSEEVA